MKKKIVFSLIPALLLLLLLVLVEVGLRFFSSSLDVRLFTEVTYDGVEWYQINRGYLEKYFPAGVVLLPEFKPSLIRKQKSANGFRVLCLGESSMFGTPYQMNANIPAIVRKQLRHLFPDKEFEVINLGASAINTNVILDVAGQLIDLHPDLVLLYTGHNEFYGPDGVGASFLEKHFPFMTPLKYRLRDLRIIRLAQNLLHGALQKSRNSRELNMMKEVSQGASIRSDSDEAKRTFSLFEHNLQEIIGVFKSEGVPIIVSDVASNLMFPPFASDWRDEFDRIRPAFDGGRYDEVYQTLTGMFRSDSTNAFINYWLGRTCLALRKPEMARLHLLRARDYDLLKFRAPTQMNDIIAGVCTKQKVPFVSSDSLLSSLSPNGITGGEFFWEHLHPNARGYALIADLFLKRILELPVAHAAGGEQLFSRRLPFNTDSLSICWLDLAYADLSMKTLTSNWPFNNYRTAAVVLDSSDETLRQIAVDVYTKKTGWTESCYRSAGHLQSIGRLRDAATTYEALIEEYQVNYYAHYLLGYVNKETGNLARAVQEYKVSIRIKPDYPYSRVELGLVQINLGDIDDAISQFRIADTLADTQSIPALKASICYGLAAAYANKGEFPRALEYIEESLKLAPSYEPAKELRRDLMQYNRGRK